jgi:hypothetical protein
LLSETGFRSAGCNRHATRRQKRPENSDAFNQYQLKQVIFNHKNIVFMSWTVTTNGFDKDDHPLQEALTTLGNGYVATRGALEMLSHKYLAEKSGTHFAGQHKSEPDNNHDTDGYEATDTPETASHSQTSLKASQRTGITLLHTWQVAITG